MRSIGRLIRGELYKYWKSKTVVIMAVLLVIVVGIMSAIYAHYDKQVSGVISLMLGGDTRVTAFDLFDGSAKELLEQAGIEPDSMEEFNRAFEKIQENPSIKAMLVAVDPAVLDAMIDMTTPAVEGQPMTAPIFAYLDGHTSPQNIAEIYGRFAAYGSFAEMQSLVAEDYLNDYITQDRGMNTRLEELSAYLRNDGAYGRTVVGYIEELIRGFYADYKTFVSAADAYHADKTYANFETLIDTFARVSVDYATVNFFTKSNVMSTNFLLIPTEGMMSMSYQTFANSLEPFKSASYTDAVTNANKIIGAKRDADTVATFKEEFLALADKSYEPRPITPAMYDMTKTEADGFVNSVNSLISTIKTGTNTIFAYESANVQQILAKIEAGETLKESEKKTVASFTTEDGTIDPLLPAVTVIRSSYQGVITEEIYNRQLAPYYDQKEKTLIDEADEALQSVQTRYSDAELIYGLFEGQFSDGLAKEKYVELYDDYAAIYREYASRTSTAKNLFVNANLYESIEANGLNDADAKKIQGFMMSSRYNLRSEVTKAQYLIENDKLAKDFVVPESLGNGWGAMQFIFVLSGIVILVFGIVLGAGAIAGEHSGGTMKLLLIRPHRRWQVLIAKFISIMIVITCMYVFNYLLTLGIGGIFWGFESLPALAIFNSTHATVLHPAVVLLLQHLFGLLEAIVFAQIALTLSTVIKSRSGAVSVSMLVYFVSFVLSSLLSSFSWYKFIIFNNTNLTQYFTSIGPSLADMTLVFSLVVDVIYIVALAFIGLFTFAKRDAT